jgi:hypothetical protein
MSASVLRVVVVVFSGPHERSRERRRELGVGVVYACDGEDTPEHEDGNGGATSDNCCAVLGAVGRGRWVTDM